MAEKNLQKRFSANCNFAGSVEGASFLQNTIANFLMQNKTVQFFGKLSPWIYFFLKIVWVNLSTYVAKVHKMLLYYVVLIVCLNIVYSQFIRNILFLEKIKNAIQSLYLNKRKQLSGSSNLGQDHLARSPWTGCSQFLPTTQKIIQFSDGTSPKSTDKIVCKLEIFFW